MPLVWLITGCSSGLGEALALAALARGDKVIATARGSVSRLQKLMDAGAATFELDVTKEFSVKDVLAIYGTVDVVVPNAGYGQMAVLEEIKLEEMRNQFDVNFFGVIRLVTAFLPHLREQRSGAIVFMNSVCAYVSGPPGGAYCATKHAIAAYSKSLRQEVQIFGINTFCFDIGYTKSEFSQKVQLKTSTIEDYAPVNAAIGEFTKDMFGNEPGDPERLVNAIIDVVKGEGLTQGKPKPHIVPMGSDTLSSVREYAKFLLRNCDTWEELGKSVDYPGPKRGTFARIPHYHVD